MPEEFENYGFGINRAFYFAETITFWSAQKQTLSFLRIFFSSEPS